MLMGMGGVLGIKDDSFLYGARRVTGAAFGTPRLVGFTHDLLIVARRVVLSSIACRNPLRSSDRHAQGIPLVPVWLS